jgi:hypothetical protein
MSSATTIPRFRTWVGLVGINLFVAGLTTGGR